MRKKVIRKRVVEKAKSPEERAREKFGLLIKDARSKKKWDRGEFGEKTGLDVEVIMKVEHGAPDLELARHKIAQMIKVLGLTQKKRNQAHALLRIFSPRFIPQVKFHLHITVLRQRKRVSAVAGRRY